jgi:hypothetical protein
MDSDLANEGVILAGTQESAVPLNLTLQWLESNTTNWPSTETALLKKVKEFCTMEVNVTKEGVVNALEGLGAIRLGPDVAKGESKAVSNKQKVEVVYDNFERVLERMKKGKDLSTATIAVLGRIIPLLLAFKGTKKDPRNRGELEDLIAPHTLVVFKVLKTKTKKKFLSRFSFLYRQIRELCLTSWSCATFSK